MTYPTPEGTAVIQEVTAGLALHDMVGARVAVLTHCNRAFNGVLTGVSEANVLTIEIRAHGRISKFNVYADNVRSCKPLLFEVSGRK